MAADPIAAILAAQHPEGFWEKPGAGYATKYRGTVWQLIFLDQLGADPADERVQRACDYVLGHSVATTGGFGASGQLDRPPPPSAVIHCLNGNLLRAVIGFGWLDDDRVQRAIEWQARAITGEGVERWYASGTSGPGFACAANEELPCGWGAAKAILGSRPDPGGATVAARGPSDRRRRRLPAQPRSRRSPTTRWAGATHARTAPGSSSGFPSGYVTDVLQVLEALVRARPRRRSPPRPAPGTGSSRSRTIAAAGATSTPTTARPGSTSSGRASPAGGSRCGRCAPSAPWPSATEVDDAEAVALGVTVPAAAGGQPRWNQA